MIKYEKVSKIYQKGSLEVINEIDWEIAKGEFVTLVGESGAGKTTLLKLLIREETPTQGQIWYKDQDIVRVPSWEIPKLRRKIGMVFQDFKLLRQLTVFENIAFVLEVTGKNKKDINDVVPYLLEQVGLLDKAVSFPSQLSTGEQQRVAIARALAHEPEVLLADEPTGNLDSKNTLQILKLLKQINQWGTTVVMATHDEKIIKNHDGPIAQLREGKLKVK